MSEEDLEVLITLDDPEDPEKEDTFHLAQNDPNELKQPQADDNKMGSD
jgi:hypothetical protein